MINLTWSHLLKILTIEDKLKRDFYITMSINERWSVRTLNERIDSMLYERTALSKKPELTILLLIKPVEKNNIMGESTGLYRCYHRMYNIFIVFNQEK